MISISIDEVTLASEFINDENAFLELLCAVFGDRFYKASKMVGYGYSGSLEHDALPMRLRELADAIETKANED